jgi:hypothetical protein
MALSLTFVSQYLELDKMSLFSRVTVKLLEIAAPERPYNLFHCRADRFCSRRLSRTSLFRGSARVSIVVVFVVHIYT